MFMAMQDEVQHACDARAIEAQRAGIAHAKANGDARAYKGRKPSYYSRKQFESV
jgi:hypothetical protein